MNSKLVNLTYEVQLQSGETLVLPDSITNSLSEGRWLVTIQPAESSSQISAPRSHAAFLNGYAPEDDNLYDACQNWTNF
jgi:hypothetical protein